MTKIRQPKAKLVVSFYWSKLKNYKLYLTLASFFIPLAVIGNNLLPPLVLANVLDRLGNKDYVSGELWESFSTEIITYIALVFISGMVLWRLVDRVVWRLEARMQQDLALQVFKHLTNQSSDFHANNFGGSLVSQNNKLLTGYLRIADTTFYSTIPLISSIIGSAVILFGKSPAFAISLIIFSVLYITMALIVSAPTRKASIKHASKESIQTGYLADAITNIMTIKSFSTNDYELKQYEKITEKTKKSFLELLKRIQIQMFSFTSMTSTITVASLIFALVSVVNFSADIATAFLIFNYTATIIGQLFQFSNQSLRNYNRAIGDATDMVNILNTELEIVDPELPEKSLINHGSIEFKNVYFRHKDSREAIFDNLNINIKSGEKVGLVGHSGSGKTTLTKLLLRFVDIQEGSIQIDGQNIAKITQNDLRHSIAYVPQEPLLFHRTIKENIGYGDPKANRKQIENAAKQANAHEFIEKLPDGYDTLVGERGVKLSGGQRQRVAIARAMLKNAPILLLDEATSALDSESEELIQDALWKLMEGRTAIVIAHRLSTIQKMDRILVMNDGAIVEEGNHKELIKRNGAYAKLWHKQSGGFIEE